MRFKNFMEALDTKVEFKTPPHLINDDVFVASAVIGKRDINMHATKDPDEEEDIWDFSFGEGEGFDVDKTGNGFEFRVFAAVKAVLEAFIDEVEPAKIKFSASHEFGNKRGDFNRANLYHRLLTKYQHPSYELTRDDEENLFTIFTLARIS